jgi:phage terminase small subunit
MPMTDSKVRAPGHLRPATRRWWREVVNAYVLESHHLRLLTLAAEAWDRCAEARAAVQEQGAYHVDKNGTPRPHPGLNVERDSAIRFARLLRELDLDIDPPAAPKRPPQLRRYDQ